MLNRIDRSFPGRPIVRSGPRSRDRPTTLGRPRIPARTIQRIPTSLGDQTSPRSRPNRTRTSARQIPRSLKVPKPEFRRSPIAPKYRLTSLSFLVPETGLDSVQDMDRARVRVADPGRERAPARVAGREPGPDMDPGDVPAVDLGMGDGQDQDKLPAAARGSAPVLHKAPGKVEGEGKAGKADGEASRRRDPAGTAGSADKRDEPRVPSTSVS